MKQRLRLIPGGWRYHWMFFNTGPRNHEFEKAIALIAAQRTTHRVSQCVTGDLVTLDMPGAGKGILR